MKVLIVYDSSLGNAEGPAQTMGQALATKAQVKVLRVSNVKPEQLSGVDVR